MGVSGCKVLLRHKLCAGVWIRGVREGLMWAGGLRAGGGGQPLRKALHTIIISLQNSFCESHTWETSELKGSERT